MGTAEKKGKLFIISGPSGTGKGTICKALLERNANELSDYFQKRNCTVDETVKC